MALRTSLTALLLLVLPVTLSSCMADGEEAEDTDSTAGSEDALTSIGNDAKNVRLIVDKNHVARVTFDSPKKGHEVVLVKGAENAMVPNMAAPQVTFNFDYGNGRKWGKPGYADKMTNACQTYDGPKLQLLVAACKDTDGSYWAVQAWQKGLKDGAKDAHPEKVPAELHISHWKGPLPTFEVYQNWAPGTHNRRLFGRLVYNGSGVYDFGSSPKGVPDSSYGRNVYWDVYDSAWGAGWRRFMGGLTHNPTGRTLDDGTPALGGNFCMAMNPKKDLGRPNPANGKKYRATVLGPGVMPILRWPNPESAHQGDVTLDQEDVTPTTPTTPDTMPPTPPTPPTPTTPPTTPPTPPTTPPTPPTTPPTTPTTPPTTPDTMPTLGVDGADIGPWDAKSTMVIDAQKAAKTKEREFVPKGDNCY